MSRTSKHEWFAVFGAAVLAFMVAADIWDVAAISIIGVFIFTMGQRDERGA